MLDNIAIIGESETREPTIFNADYRSIPIIIDNLEASIKNNNPIMQGYLKQWCHLTHSQVKCLGLYSPLIFWKSQLPMAILMRKNSLTWKGECNYAPMTYQNQTPDLSIGYLHPSPSGG